MNWNIQKAQNSDAAIIASFQIEMALESEGHGKPFPHEGMERLAQQRILVDPERILFPVFFRETDGPIRRGNESASVCRQG